MKLNSVFSLLCLSGLGCVLFAATPDKTILSVMNNTGDTVHISYKRTIKGPWLGKLLEQGEALTFGIVAEASLSGVGVIGKYTTPASAHLFPPQTPSIKDSKQCIVIIEGTINRSLTKPFGDWNLQYIVDKVPEQLFPSLIVPKKDMVIDAFPTAVRKSVPTPRFILGLSDDAKTADAIEAATMLSNKWLARKASNPEEAQVIVAIIHTLNDARIAFENGRPDELLTELAVPGALTVAFAD